jgi:hypothetical protein
MNRFQSPNQNFGLILTGTSAIFNMYLLTIGTLILGFSTYIALETLGGAERSIVQWTGEGFLWIAVLFFMSLFILFIPIDLLKPKFDLTIGDFGHLVGYIVFTIGNSIFFLLLSRFINPNNNDYLSEVANLFEAVSFSGLIVIPISLFLLFQFKKNIKYFEGYYFYLLFLVWTMSSQLFL